MCRVCRTCLEVIEEGLESFSLDGTVANLGSTCNNKTKLEACVPEMTLNMVKNSVICSHCLTALSVAHEFRTKCLQTEQKIYNYMLRTKSGNESIDLNFVVKESKHDDKSSQKITLSDKSATEETRFEESFTPGTPNMVTIKAENYIKFEHSDLDYFADEQVFVKTESYDNAINSDEGLQLTHLCHICQKYFKYKSALKKHLESHNHAFNKGLEFDMQIETNDRCHKCAECDFVATFKKHLYAHMSQVHGDNRPFKCPNCEYSGTTKSHLNRHMRIHIGLKPYKCSYCKFSTAYKNNLKDHINIHEGYKPYKCVKCKFSTSTKHHLNKHMRIHSGNKHECLTCGFSTVYQNSLKKHMSMHKHSDCDDGVATEERLNENT